MASSAELVIIKPAGRRLQARKAWQLVIGSERVSVDAISAEAILVESLIERWADTPATGLSVYDGTVQFTASVDVGGTPHRLRSESTPGGAIAVLRGNNIWNSTTGDFNFDSANDFASGSGSDFGGAYPNGVSALWGAQRALAYFNSEHGIIDLDGSGLPTRIFLNLAHGALLGAQCPVFWSQRQLPS